jgi:hypothetical protein
VRGLAVDSFEFDMAIDCHVSLSLNGTRTARCFLCECSLDTNRSDTVGPASLPMDSLSLRDQAALADGNFDTRRSDTVSPSSW